MAAKRTYPVTAAHIAAGRRGSCSRCPIALAIRDKDDVSYVSVCRTWAYTWDAAGARRQASLGRDGGDFTYAFDRGERVEPFTLTLRWEAV